MSRKSKNLERKPYIVIFWEGESEKEYFKCIKDKFHDVANLELYQKKGLFSEVSKSFKSKGKCHGNASDIDEIWIVFDTEDDLHPCWNDNWQIVKRLKKRFSHIKVKMYMTKGCIEYFFLLHFEQSRPPIASPKDKSAVEKKLRDNYCHGYKKGDHKTTQEIAINYPKAIENGNWCLKQFYEEIDVESGNLHDDEEYFKRLYYTDHTFTNTHKAVEYLNSLREKSVW